VLLVLTSATQARRNYAESQPHVESVVRNEALSVPCVHTTDFIPLNNRWATTTLQVLIEHLQAVAAMPTRSTEGNQESLPFDFRQSQQADVQVLACFSRCEEPFQFITHFVFHLSQIRISLNNRLYEANHPKLW